MTGRSAAAKSRALAIGVRRARPEDRDAVLAFASTTWGGWDYIPDAWPQWIAANDGVLLVAVPADPDARDAEGHDLAPGVPIALTRVALLAMGQAWLEGIRVDPRVRGRSVATTLQVAELLWAAAHGAHVMRYVTGESNEASLRLGARHGFERLRDRRSYGPPEAGREARAAWPVLRDRFAQAGLLVHAPDARRWWKRIESDPTFAAGDRLYEHRAWTLLELDDDRLAEHAAASQVLARETADSWALAIKPRFSGWAEDEGIHLGLLAGSDASAVAALVREINSVAGFSHRARLPDPDPPLLAGGDAAAFAAIGYRPHEHVLKVMARPLDAAHPLPEPDEPGLLELLDEPTPVAIPPPVAHPT